MTTYLLVLERTMNWMKVLNDVIDHR